MTPTLEERDARAAHRHQQLQALRRVAVDGAAAIQSQHALQIARERHGCRGVLAPLPVADDVFAFECADCHSRIEVSALEAAT